MSGLISASVISKPRKSRRCEHCGKSIMGETLRLYGAAQDGDKPYAIYLHPACVTWRHPKIEKVMP